MAQNLHMEEELLERYSGCLLSDVEYWYISNNGGLAARVLDDRSESWWHEVSETDLLFYGENMPGIVRSLLAHYQESGLDLKVPGSLVAASKVLLERGVVTVECFEGPQHFLYVYDFVVPADLVSEVVLCGTTLEEKKLFADKDDAYLVTRTGFSKPCITRQFLDQQYPGWLNRYNAGLLMQMDCWELVRFVFIKPEVLDSRVLPNDVSCWLP